MQLMLAASLLLLASAVAAFKRDALHPGCLQSGLWGLVCLAYFTIPHPYRTVSLDTIVLIVGASLVFVIASISVASTTLPAGPTQLYETTVLRPLLFWLALLGLPAFVLRALTIAHSAELTESMFVNLRIALTGEDGDAQTYGLLGYLLPVAFTSVLVELTASRRRGFELKGWIALSVAICYAVLATGRTYLFFLLIALSFVALLQRRAKPLHMLGILTALTSLAFFGIGVLLNKIGADLPNANALGAIDAIGLYLLSGLAAFDLTSHQPHVLDFGTHVFRSVMALLNALGFKVEVASTLKEYVYVPEAANVYTVFYPYTKDFGKPGALVAMALLGWMHARLYRSANRGNPRSVILYATSMYPLLLQFFDDQYFSLLSMWVSYVILVTASFRRRTTQALA